MKRLIAIVLLFCLGVGSAAYAATGFNIIPLLGTNTAAGAVAAPALAFRLSSQSLVDGSWMSSTGLNAELQDGGVGIGYMPGTGRVRMLACFNNAGVDQTAACNNATAGDVTLPVTVSAVYEFAADSQFAHQWLNVSTAAAGASWDIVWEYYNGVSYVALSNVSDGTAEFTTAGLHRVSWSFPAAGLWPQSVLHGITGYWVRARVSAFTALPVSPLGQQAYYETGRLWTTVPSIGGNEQKRFDYVLDTSPTLQTDAQFSVAVSADDAYLEAIDFFVYPPAFTGVSNIDTAISISRSSTAEPTYTIRDAYLRFDTSALPDHISPDMATLRCHVITKVDTDARSLVAEWYPWSGTLGKKDYNATALASAMGGIAIAVINTGVVNSFTLQNLHHINKAGYTGIRLSISGGASAGQNVVEIAAQDDAALQECILVLDYNGSRAYHDFFPHPAGYALADNAALEPSTAFSQTLVGFFDASLPAGTDILTKGAAGVGIEWTWAAGNVVEIYRLGVNELDCTGVTTGYHTLTLRSLGGAAANRIECLTDGVITGTSGAAMGYPNVANAWAIGMEMPYIEYFYMEVGGVAQVLHQIRTLPTHQIINQANPGTFDATVRYPDAVSGFTTQILPLEPTGVVATTDPLFDSEFVDGIGELTNLDPGEHLNEPTFPVFVILKVLADSSNGALPYAALLMGLAFLLCVGATMGSWAAFHSVHVTWFALVAASTTFIFVGDGVWTWMIPFGTGVTGLVYVFWRRGAV